MSDITNQFKGSASSRLCPEPVVRIELPNGDVEWFRHDGKLHHEDGPAYITAEGTEIWYRYGQRHRENGPAVEYKNGGKEWWVNGKRHREDGPAVEEADGTKKWYYDDLLHREGGPAKECKNGDTWWCIHGELHREDGPAIRTRVTDLKPNESWMWNGLSLTKEQFDQVYELRHEPFAHKTFSDGLKIWLCHGKLHREDGPAVEGKHGKKEWYRHGKRHREGGPAIINGEEESWYRDGKLHREDGPAAFVIGHIVDDRIECWKWYQDGQLYREDCEGRLIYYHQGQCHREDGPAVENKYSGGERRWYHYGRKLDYEQFQQLREIKEKAVQEVFEKSIDEAISNLKQGVVARPVRRLFDKKK